MSLIDSVALGRCRMSSAVQLAALGPAGVLLMLSNYLLMS
jgi:hypothetical protein